MNLVMLGAPGAGKGTQAARLAQSFDIAHISTGDIFRTNLSQGTQLGKTAKAYMERGALVPDDVTVAMVEDRLSQPDAGRGFVLDGFPRTLPQAEAFDAMLARGNMKLNRAVHLTVPDAVLIARLTGRRVCAQCGATFHVEFHPPKREGICDACGAELVVRPDDQEETVRTRIAVYNEQTAPLVSYYLGRGILLTVDGEEAVEAITGFLVSALSSKEAR